MRRPRISPARAARRLLGAACVCLIAAAAWAAGAAHPDAAAGVARALAGEEQRLGDASPELLPLLGRLAHLRFYAGDLAAAAALRRRALDIAVAADGSQSLPAAAAMAALAALDIARLRYLDAEPLLIAAREAFLVDLGPGAPALAPVLAGLSAVALARGDQSAAQSYGEQAVAAAANGPPDRQSEPLRADGAALAAEDRFDEGGQVLRQALARDLATEGDDGFGTARSLSQLARLDIRAKRFNDALPLVEAATQIDQSRLGPAHPFIADDLYDLGVVYDATGRAADAEIAFRAAIKLLERGIGRDTPRVAYVELELARVYRERGSAAESDAAFEDAHRILKAAEAEEHKRERQA